MFDNIFNILTDNLTFIIIGVIVIGILIFAYFAFVRIGPYETEDKKSEENKLQAQPKKVEANPIQESNNNFTQPSIEKKDLDEPKSQNTHDQNLRVDDLLEKPENNISLSKKNDDTKNSKEVNNQSNNKSSKLKKEEKHIDEAEDKEKKDQSNKGSNDLGKYHVLYRDKDKKWYVKREGSDKVIRVLYTKKEAIAYATIKAINQDSDIVIHSKDGKIEKHGYM